MLKADGTWHWTAQMRLLDKAASLRRRAGRNCWKLKLHLDRRTRDEMSWDGCATCRAAFRWRRCGTDFLECVGLPTWRRGRGRRVLTDGRSPCTCLGRRDAAPLPRTGFLVRSLRPAACCGLQPTRAKLTWPWLIFITQPKTSTNKQTVGQICSLDW